jgi:hypothetical protein
MKNNLEYKYLSTFELIKNVALHSDNIALNEILASRKLLVLKKKKRLLLPEYLWQLKERNFYPFVIVGKNERNVDEKIDRTYDLILQKFLILKPSIITNENKGPYCDNQYKELYKKINELKIERKIHKASDYEEAIEKIFRNMVVRHLKYSWGEVCRQMNHFYHRYRWELPAETMELKKPRWKKGNEFRRWLEINVWDEDNEKSLERKQVQKKIYDSFGHPFDISIDVDNDLRNKLSVIDDPIEMMKKEDMGNRFYESIADEKANNVQRLRPSIRNLGKEKIKELVLYILNNFNNDDYNDITVANKFGLSKATYSRFAGKDWKKGKVIESPDLIRNIAKVVNSHPIFLEVVTDLGQRDVINTILNAKEEK